MKIEVSAGGVVYRHRGKGFQILLLRDKNNNWTFPKGAIENHEEKIQTAKREIAEEVGLKKIKFILALSPISYWYMQKHLLRNMQKHLLRNKWQKDLVKKTVYYFLFEATGQERPKPQKEEGISRVKWFSPEKALEIVGYRKTNNPVLEAVIEKIKNEKL